MCIRDSYRTVPSPAFDIRYKDLLFLSDGDGLGVNLLRGETYRAGVALGYDCLLYTSRCV